MAKPVTLPRGRASRTPSANGTGHDRAIKNLTQVFKSLADEHRIRVLFLLSERGEMNVSAIGEELGQSQPAISHHLTQLRTAGLIDFRREGKFNFYSLSSDGLGDLIEQLYPIGPAKLQFGGIEVGFKRK